MEALFYENVIRQAFQCGRYGVEGANADIYRAFEHAWNLHQDALNNRYTNSTKSHKELEQDARRNASIVSTHIKNAIDEVLERHKTVLNEEQVKSLKANYNKLFNAKKEDVDAAVLSSSDIFSEIGLLA